MSACVRARVYTCYYNYNTTTTIALVLVNSATYCGRANTSCNLTYRQIKLVGLNMGLLIFNYLIGSYLLKHVQNLQKVYDFCTFVALKLWIGKGLQLLIAKIRGLLNYRIDVDRKIYFLQPKTAKKVKKDYGGHS